MAIRAPEFRAYIKMPTIDDAEILAENANDPDVARMVAKRGEFPHPYTKANASSFIEFAQFAAKSGVEFHFGIYSMATDKIMGMIALMRNQSEQDPKTMEVGYWLGKPYWGQGYAKEALLLALKFGFEDIGLDRVVAETTGDNARSIRVLEHAKFSRYAPDAQPNGANPDPKLHYELKREGYERLKLSDERMGRIYST
ncbi:MAG: GNAT family N-acetyltransferase [Candidatus Micrarchaeota archaeon]|nr:GNAT family N-acetyltransferase [Candidatus Micrarchaeota archaeon]